MSLARPLTLAVALVALSATACARTEAATPPAAPQVQAAHAAPRGDLPRLVFFMNPFGRPCQMQDQILQEMAPSLSGKVEVVYYKTSDQADLARFAQYGIRALPMLILTDATGRELRRATPGVQGPPQVLQLIGG
jgi:thioredoxin 1